MISVVVPAFNEQEGIARCLDSLAHQDYRGHFEVIVVDNNSTDDTAIIAGDLGVRVIKQKRKGIAWARQGGFMAARGDIIASTDADTVVPPDWLWRIERLFSRNKGAVAVAGHFLLLDGPSVVRLWLRLSLWLMPYVLRLAPWLWRFSGINFAVRANAFAAVGGFKTDMEFGEDADLCQRLRRLGRVVFEPRLVVKTSGRAFLRDRLGLKYFLNYLSLLVRGKALLAIRHRADLKEQGVMAPKVRQMPRIAVRGSPALATLTKYQAAPPGFIGVRPTLGGIL